MPSADTSRRAEALNWRLAVNGIQKFSRLGVFERRRVAASRVIGFSSGRVKTAMWESLDRIIARSNLSSDSYAAVRAASRSRVGSSSDGSGRFV
jgi:hypothetical protein